MAREMKDSGIEWIGEIPAEWESKKLKYIVTYNDETLEESTDDEYEFDYIDIGSVQYGKGIVQLQRMTFKDAPSRARRIVKENDVIVSTVRTYLKAVTMINASTIPLVASTGFIVLRAKQNEILSSFLNYAVLSDAFISMIEARSFGISYPAINATSVVDISIPLPQIEEQKSISEFLNTECSRIDSAIEQTRASIEEYKKLKQAVITQAVTKGIRPGRQMKDSGIEWLGSIAFDWKLFKLKAIISLIESGTSVNAAQYPASDGEIGVLKTSCVSRLKFIPSENKAVNTDEIYRVSCPVKANTIIMSRMNTPDLVGACGFIEIDYPNLFLPDRLWQVHFEKTVNVKYLWYYLNSKNIRNYYGSLAVGTSSSMQNISQDQFYLTYIPLPSENEQNEIVSYLDEKVEGIDTLITEKERLLSNLESYKKSLIYEYVTGKKEVPA